MYTIQLPNINTPVYAPRRIRVQDLQKINDINVDLNPLMRVDRLDRSYLYVPDCTNQLVSALWLSAVINCNVFSQNPGDLSFLGDTELNFLESTITREDKGLDTTSIYDLTKMLDTITHPRGYRVSLAKLNSSTDMLLALMEGYTVMVGGTEYESFPEAELTGIVRMPKPGEALLRGHVFNVVSFNQEKDLALVLGNRGMEVGKRGHFQCTGSYLRNLNICKDFFVLVPRIGYGD